MSEKIVSPDNNHPEDESSLRERANVIYLKAMAEYQGKKLTPEDQESIQQRAKADSTGDSSVRYGTPFHGGGKLVYGMADDPSDLDALGKFHIFPNLAGTPTEEVLADFQEWQSFVKEKFEAEIRAKLTMEANPLE